MSYEIDYDNPNPFDDLCADIAGWQRDRDRRERGRETLAKSMALDTGLGDEAADWDHQQFIKSLRQTDRNLADTRRLTDQAAATAKRWAQETPLLKAESAQRRAAEQVAGHRELVRQQIPQMLQKALEIQRRGGCSAHDVCVLQSELHHLAQRWL